MSLDTDTRDIDTRDTCTRDICTRDICTRDICTLDMSYRTGQRKALSFFGFSIGHLELAQDFQRYQYKVD
jgi:hypothetical protein